MGTEYPKRGGIVDGADGHGHPIRQYTGANDQSPWITTPVIEIPQGVEIVHAHRGVM
jgi:hypothetical protein